MDKSLVEGVAHNFDKKEVLDVFFLVEGKEIGVHKVVLAAQCQFLYDMSKDWNPTKKPIPVDDIHYKSFEDFLRFLYCREVALSGENIFLFLSASVQFKMKYLEEKCVNHIARSMDANSAASYMKEAVQFGSKLLQKICLKIFEKRTQGVIRSQSFMGLSQPALSAFLDAEETNVSEITLFCYVREWMRLKCEEQDLATTGENMRVVLGDATFKIRFPTMGSSKFANDVRL